MEAKLRIGICGDVCSECPRYTATLANDQGRLVEFAELWHRLGFRETVVSPESLRCSGCSRDMACANGVNRCEQLGDGNNCGECDNFPCETIGLVFSKTDELDSICREKCSESEYEMLSRAFLRKRELLTCIHEGRKK